jgi:hypothetical protein
VGGRINFACDLNNDDALTVAEREKAHLDQAFFVLGFAALENQVTSLASAREAVEDRRIAMRGADFERRWDAAAKVSREVLGAPIHWETGKSVVLSWYTIRSDIAHGRAPSQFADVPAVLYRADEIAATFDQVDRTLNAM